jgi:nitrogen-specific signal transduction histidine kinase
MDGAIELDSEPGRTVFSLILPAADVPAGMPEPVLP